MPPTLSYAATALLFLAELTSCASSSSSRWSAFAFLPHTNTHRSITTQLKQHRQRFGTHLYSTSPIVDEIPSDETLDEEDSSDPESILQSRNKLIALSQTLSANSSSGKIFVTRPADKIKLQNAVNNLEALAESSASSEQSSKKDNMLLGDWILIVTANLPSSDIRRRFDSNENKKGGVWGTKKQKRSGLSLFGADGQSKLNPIQKSLQQTIEVTQRIRNDYNGGDTHDIINRVDNVIEFTPLNTLEDILPSSLPIYDIVSKINVNPLQISKGKVVLIHKAEIESSKPILRTKISWTSSVLNVAGESQYFDTEGDDVFGINNLLGEFINVGTFDTPYVDDDVRISRTSGSVFETLRVFVKKGSSLLDEDNTLLGNLSAELRVEEDMEVEQSENDVGTQVKKVVDAADNVQKSISSMTSNAKSTIEKDMESVNKVLGETMDDVVGKVQDVVEDDIEQIGKAVQDVQSAIQDEGYELVDAIQNVTKAVAKVPLDVKDIVDKDAEDLRTKTTDALDSMVADVQDTVESDLKDVEKSMEDMRDAVSGSSDDDNGDDTDEETKDAKKDE